jgi:hypothetical protein
MTTTTQVALTKAHERLAGDLANLSQLIDPLNQQALAMLYRVQRRLQDIEELARTKVNGDNTREGLTGVLIEDTLAHVSDVLVVLANLDYKDCGSEEYACGMLKILSCAWESLEHEVGRVRRLRKRAKEVTGEAKS